MNKISTKLILERLQRHPYLQGVTQDEVIDYIYTYLDLSRILPVYTEKVDKVKISKHKGMLPCDCFKVIQVRDLETNMPYMYSTDNFFYSDKSKGKDLTYKIQGDILTSSYENRDVEISYIALEVDEEGFPVVPNNEALLKAIEAYIKVEKFTILFDMNKIALNVLNNAQQDYCFRAGQAEVALKEINDDIMESITNELTSLVIQTHGHHNGYRDINKRQHINLR